MLITKFAPVIGFGSVVMMQVIKASSAQFGKVSQFFLEKEEQCHPNSWKATACKVARGLTCGCHVMINAVGLALAAGCTVLCLGSTVWLVSASVSLGSSVAATFLGGSVLAASLACTILLGKFLVST